MVGERFGGVTTLVWCTADVGKVRKAGACVCVRVCGGGGCRGGEGLRSSGIVQLLLFNYAPFSSQLKDHDIIIT